MRAIAGGSLVLTLALLAAAADDDPRTRLYTSPSPPPRAMLDRLNLVTAWRALVPMDSTRDRFESVPGRVDRSIACQFEDRQHHRLIAWDGHWDLTRAIACRRADDATT